MTVRLIVNADDLGYTDGVNRGIVEAHRRGIVTSTSLMVDHPAAAHGVDLASGEPRLGIGLHAVVDDVQPERLDAELERQLVRFRALVGREPTHVDSHHHAHRDTALRGGFEAFAHRHRLPLRDREARHDGSFYGAQVVTVERLLALLRTIVEDPTELGCHPGHAEGLRSSYTTERELELATLTDPRVRATVHELGVRLVHWGELMCGRSPD